MFLRLGSPLQRLSTEVLLQSILLLGIVLILICRRTGPASWTVDMINSCPFIRYSKSTSIFSRDMCIGIDYSEKMNCTQNALYVRFSCACPSPHPTSCSANKHLAAP
ncbi:unnamed protein product [Amoebophrya sp. A120]|nr:unnamed protein product [Amoebophrya sp. A120]|eukprot:GSA120T00006004001.1